MSVVLVLLSSNMAEVIEEAIEIEDEDTTYRGHPDLNLFTEAESDALHSGMTEFAEFLEPDNEDEPPYYFWGLTSEDVLNSHEKLCSKQGLDSDDVAVLFSAATFLVVQSYGLDALGYRTAALASRNMANSLRGKIFTYIRVPCEEEKVKHLFGVEKWCERRVL